MTPTTFIQLTAANGDIVMAGLSEDRLTYWVSIDRKVTGLTFYKEYLHRDEALAAATDALGLNDLATRAQACPDHFVGTETLRCVTCGVNHLNDGV